MKFIRDNPGLTFTAVLIFALIGTMVVFLVSNSPGSPAGVSVPRVSETPTLRQAQGSALRAETLAPSVTPTLLPTATPTIKPSATPTLEPTATPLVCTDADREAIRQALDEATTYENGGQLFSLAGLHYETNGAFPPSATLYTVSSGEIRTEQRDGYSLDLARLFYLTSQKELLWLWLAIGVQYPDGSYMPINQPDFAPLYWPSSEQAVAYFNVPGRLLSTGISDWYVRPDAVHWENCGKWQRYTPAGFCEIGMELELESFGGSAELFKTEHVQQNWIAFNWTIDDVDPDGQPVMLALPESASLCR